MPKSRVVLPIKRLVLGAFVFVGVAATIYTTGQAPFQAQLVSEENMSVRVDSPYPATPIPVPAAGQFVCSMPASAADLSRKMTECQVQTCDGVPVSESLSGVTDDGTQWVLFHCR